MLVHKYYVRPADESTQTAALDEIARYVQARNRLLKLHQKWIRIQEEQILPAFRELAATYRATPRTGRKPSKAHSLGKGGVCRHCEQVIEPEDRKLDCPAPTAGTRRDREELMAANSRELYAEFIAAGGSYATWWLAEAAAKKAKHPVRDEYAGRAGVLPQWLRWNGAAVSYCGTQWTVHRKQLAKRPMPEHAEVVQAWFQRERTTSSLMRKPHYKWFLVIVLDNVSPRMHPVPAKRTAAGLDLAWRQDDDEKGETLRVAYVADDHGAHHSIKMRAQHYERIRHAESLERLADEDANRLRVEFGKPNNTSRARLLELVEPEHPIAAHMVHLAIWEHGARRNAIRSRDAHYLAIIHDLCRAHHTIYVEKMKGNPALVQKASTRKKKGAPASAEGGVARGQRQIAAPFTFLRMLQRVAPQFKTEIVEVAAAYTSRICYACQHDMGPSGKGERSCVSCGQRWDVDHLAALNLLEKGTARKPTADAAE